MRRRILLNALPLWLLPPAPVVRAQLGGVVVIGHAGLERIDVPTVQRIYTGRMVELGNVSVNPANVAAGHPVRSRFLATYLKQDDEKYLAYWTVRRYIGKGVPPREFSTPAEVIRFVLATPGGIGYVDEASLEPGLNVLVR